MGRKAVVLQQIDNDHPITKDTDYEFLYRLQNALLLALCEQGQLNTMQYRHAEESLRKQYLDPAENLRVKGISR